MDTLELQKLAEKTRLMREIGIALLFATVTLALFLFISPDNRSQEDAVANTPAPAVADAIAKVPPIAASAAIVYDLSTGETLFEKNADAQLPLASLTKLLTVYAALSSLPPTMTITVPESGETFSLSDLARLTLTASLNDAASAIAEAAARYENHDQVAMLAAAAASLDLDQTYAVNGTGLDINSSFSGGYGSARDLAKLAGALVEQYPDISLATTRQSAEAVSESGEHYSVKNTDPFVDVMPRLLLSKTGFTDLAGGNLALVFDAGIGHPVAVVVLGSTASSRFTDGTALMSYALAHYAGVASL